MRLGDKGDTDLFALFVAVVNCGEMIRGPCLGWLASKGDGEEGGAALVVEGHTDEQVGRAIGVGDKDGQGIEEG
jgi:hypothetical protein